MNLRTNILAGQLWRRRPTVFQVFLTLSIGFCLRSRWCMPIIGRRPIPISPLPMASSPFPSSLPYFLLPFWGIVGGIVICWCIHRMGTSSKRVFGIKLIIWDSFPLPHCIRCIIWWPGLIHMVDIIKHTLVVSFCPVFVTVTVVWVAVISGCTQPLTRAASIVRLTTTATATSIGVARRMTTAIATSRRGIAIESG